MADFEDVQRLGLELEESLPSEAKEILRGARERESGSVQWMIGDSHDYERLIVPNPHVPHDVTFTDTAGNRMNELTVTQASNAIGITYHDLSNSKRPAHDFGFVVADDAPSSKHHIEEAFGISRGGLLDSSRLWLSQRELVVIPAKIADGPDGSVIDTAFITTKSMAWAKLAWDGIHGAPSAERLREEFDPKAVFLNVPGLRPTLFGGTQSTVFDRRDDSCLVITNSTYQGLAMSKKPIFVLTSREMVEKGQGFLFHATLAELRGTGPQGEVRKGIMYQGRSGHGKTEFRFVRHGLVNIGESDSGDLTIDYPKSLLPERLIAGGDDGVTVRNFNTDGYGIGENNEKNGAFDRPTGAKQPGDLPENEQVLRLAQELNDPHRNLLLSIAVRQNEEALIHKRVLGADGNPHSNPRQTYSWRDLGETEALQDVNVEVSTDAMRFDTTIFGMGTTRDYAVTSWAQKLPLCSAFTLNLAGLCKVKSVSVTEDPNAKNGGGGLMTDMFGTMEGFTINEVWKNVNRYWEFFEQCNKLDHFTTPIGWVGPKYKVGDNQAELLLRDTLYQVEVGNASWDLTPGPLPFFGLRPERANFLGNEIPVDYNDPMRQFASATAFKDAAHHVMTVVSLCVEPLLHDDRIHANAKRAIAKALSAPLFVSDRDEAWTIYEQLNRL